MRRLTLKDGSQATVVAHEPELKAPPFARSTSLFTAEIIMYVFTKLGKPLKLVLDGYLRSSLRVGNFR